MSVSYENCVESVLTTIPHIRRRCGPLGVDVRKPVRNLRKGLDVSMQAQLLPVPNPNWDIKGNSFSKKVDIESIISNSDEVGETS